MARFEAVRTITGGELFDNMLGRPVDVFYSFERAALEADRLNGLVRDGGRKLVTSALAREALS